MLAHPDEHFLAPPQPYEPRTSQNTHPIAWLPPIFSKVPVELGEGCDPWDLFLTYKGSDQRLIDLQNLLKSETLDACSVDTLTEGSAVVVWQRGQFYRAITTSPVQTETSRLGIFRDRVRLLKIDYNQESIATVSELYHMPEAVAKFPCQVIRCCVSKDLNLKRLWGPEPSSLLSQFCQDFIMKIDFVEMLHESTCSYPKFLVEMWFFSKKLNEEVSVNQWLHEKLFPAMEMAYSMEREPYDSLAAFVSVYDALSPFSISVDELFAQDPIECEEAGRCECVSVEASCEIVDQEDAHTELPGIDDMSEKVDSNGDCRIDQPHPEQVEMSIEKVQNWMNYEPVYRKPSIHTSFEEPTFGVHLQEYSLAIKHPSVSTSPSNILEDGKEKADGPYLPADDPHLDADGPHFHGDGPYLPPEGKRVKMDVHHVLTGTTFYATINEFSIEVGAPGFTGNTLANLYEDINERVSHPALESPPQVGDLVLALGHQRYLSEKTSVGKGKKWLRAMVKGFTGTTYEPHKGFPASMEVFFVDFGNTETISVRDFRKLLPEFETRLPFQAVLVELAFLEQAKREAQMRLTQLLKGKVVEAEILECDVASHRLVAIVFTGSTIINNLLAAEELCLPV